jgi:hypothetical protein
MHKMVGWANQVLSCNLPTTFVWLHDFSTTPPQRVVLVGTSSAGAMFPYTYYSCPSELHSSEPPAPENDAEEQTFDPRAPRSNFNLFPLEHLLYCTECHEIRCARCMVEEVICWYCPTCLFEVPSSTVRSEGNRHGIYYSAHMAIC